MRLVPFERREEVERLLESYREKYDERLEYGAERLRDEIAERGMAHHSNAGGARRREAVWVHRV